MPTQAVTRNYYEVLGVPRKAKLAALRRRYITLTQEVHPDRFSEPAEKARKAEEFKWVNEAWQVLSDPVQRRRYDASLDVGGEFRPSETGEKTAESIFNDAKRFEFSKWLDTIPQSLRELVRKQLQDVKEFDHRVIAAFPVQRSTARRSPLTTPCGQSQTEYLILTNLCLYYGVEGKSETKRGNTTYKMTYSRLESLYLGSIDRLNVGVSFERNEGQFGLRVHAPESPFCGVDFECAGSPFVFLWVADLFDIPTRLELRPAAPVSPVLPVVVSACLAALGIWAAATATELVVVWAGLALAGASAIQGVLEALRAARVGRLMGHTQGLVQRFLKQRGV